MGKGLEAEVECIQEQAYWCRALHELIHVAAGFCLCFLLYFMRFALSLFLSLVVPRRVYAIKTRSRTPKTHALANWLSSCVANMRLSPRPEHVRQPLWPARCSLSPLPFARLRSSHSLHSGAKFMAHGQCVCRGKKRTNKIHCRQSARIIKLRSSKIFINALLSKNLCALFASQKSF